MAVDVAEERLAARVHHLHRATRAKGQQAGVDVQAHVLARAERSSDATERQPHLVRRQADALRHLVSIVVQPLGRHDQVDAAVLGRCGEPRLRSHERLILHADVVRAFN